MSHTPRTNESHPTYKWVTSHIRMRHVYPIKEPYIWRKKNKTLQSTNLWCKDPYVIQKKPCVWWKVTQLYAKSHTSDQKVILTPNSTNLWCKEPYVIQKKPYVWSKVTHIICKEPLVWSKSEFDAEQHVSLINRALFRVQRALYLMKKAPCHMQRALCLIRKCLYNWTARIFGRKSHKSDEKSPISYAKSHVSDEKSPISYSKRPMSDQTVTFTLKRTNLWWKEPHLVCKRALYLMKRALYHM